MAFSSQREITLRDLEEGDLIEFYRAMGTFSHWAVYVGNGKVIHLSPNSDVATGKFYLADIKSGTSVRMDNIKTVAGDSTTYRNNEFDDEFRPYNKAEIVKRAKKETW
ncbi:phospholipase A and acyltransferase 3-like [Ruditapes philippinarum]|uniref:phospholipase A and acyltransferase 3-like n=1 Tax=Ruditapes philippinarum TaxID=129788 RepID=UPI00295B0574|nr:phospholipase A and acyltransferase 3-like [Ruditapes philippinarum]